MVHCVVLQMFWDNACYRTEGAFNIFIHQENPVATKKQT